MEETINNRHGHQKGYLLERITHHGPGDDSDGLFQFASGASMAAPGYSFAPEGTGPPGTLDTFCLLRFLAWTTP